MLFYHNLEEQEGPSSDPEPDCPNFSFPFFSSEDSPSPASRDPSDGLEFPVREFNADEPTINEEESKGTGRDNSGKADVLRKKLLRNARKVTKLKFE